MKKSILKNNKALILAYDQGLEHGPTDFNDKNVDPLYILDIAKNKKSGVTAIAFQKGIAEKYKSEIKSSGIPLILKLNGKTKMTKGEPFSPKLTTVAEAKKLGAAAVGYTIYFGSEKEGEMLEDFAVIEREAHKNNMEVVVWSYPRGKSVDKLMKTKKGKNQVMAYAARADLEVGADSFKPMPLIF
jgi:class I fructose-bisphosphate aldolase